MNNKGFTLVELLAVVLLLAVVSTIGTYAVSSYIKASRIKSDKILWENIKTASKQYIDECTSGVSNLSCTITQGPEPNTKTLETTIQDLADYGFLNSVTNESNHKIVVLDSKKNDIGECKLTISKITDANYNVSYNMKAKDEENDEKICEAINNKDENF